MSNDRLSPLMADMERVLKTDRRVYANGKLLKNKLTELILILDENLLEAFLSSECIREQFFTKKIFDNKIIYVFEKKTCLAFVNNTEFLPKSFTKFKNKIVLSGSRGVFTNKKDLVLLWSSDLSRKESSRNLPANSGCFFHCETLSSHEIDRLCDPKVFTNFRRCDKHGEQSVKSLADRDNFLVKGHSIVVLHSLKNKYRGRIKLFHMDVPDWRDQMDGSSRSRWDRSTWLTFMKNRLELVKEFLREDGVVFLRCESTEQPYLKILMDGIFGRANFIGDLIQRLSERSCDRRRAFESQHKNTLIFSRNKKKVFLKGRKKTYKLYKNPDGDPNGFWTADNPTAARRKYNSYYFEIKNPHTGKSDWPPEHCEWRFSKDKFKEYIRDGTIVFKKTHPPHQRGFIFKRYKKKIKSPFNLLGSLETTVWKERDESPLFVDSVDGDTARAEEFLKVIIESATEKEDIILDDCVNGGRVLAVAHALERQYIGIEQSTVMVNHSVESLKKVLLTQSTDTHRKSFVRCDLMPWNERYIQKIYRGRSFTEIFDIYQDMKKNAFFRYEVNEDAFDRKLFEKLSLEEQKQILWKILDKNHLYIHWSEMDDCLYGVSKRDKKLNKQFYSGMEYFA